MKKRTERTMEEKTEKQEPTKDELEMVTGGASYSFARCPSCGSTFCTIRNGRRICDECGCQY